MDAAQRLHPPHPPLSSLTSCGNSCTRLFYDMFLGILYPVLVCREGTISIHRDVEIPRSRQPRSEWSIRTMRRDEYARVIRVVCQHNKCMPVALVLLCSSAVFRITRGAIARLSKMRIPIISWLAEPWEGFGVIPRKGCSRF